MKALIVTYYWPPAGGPGVQRWLLFTKYLAEFGVQPIVFVPDNPHYPLVDASLTAQVSKDIEIIRFPIKEPYHWARFFSKKKTQTISSGIISEKKKQSLTERILLWIRGNFFIPDARKNWVQPSVDFLENYVTENQIEVLVTTGPPHSLHLIGLRLKEKNKLRWIADFRDPWSSIGYHKKLKLTSASQKKHTDLEKKVLQTADDIIVTSPGTRKEFESKTDKPIHLITNGYDRTLSASSVLDEKFTITHTGSLISGRNPVILWEVLKELSDGIPGFSEDLNIQFAGVVNREVLEGLKEYNLNKNFNLLGYIPYNQVVDIINSSQILLLIEIDSPETRDILPGKLYEYLASRRPILAFGPEGSDVEKIILETRSGEFFTYRDRDKLKEILGLWYQRYKNGSLAIESRQLEQFHRRNLTQKLATLIKNNN